jgi:sugar phosphate isomerase/epimerase
MEDYLNHKLGISSWAFPWAVGVSKGPRLKRRLTAYELLEKAAELGVGLVQMADNLTLEELPWETLVKCKRLAIDTGIHMEVGTWGVQPDHLMKFLEIAHFMHSPILRTHPTSPGKRLEVSEIASNLREVLPEFQKFDITIVLENREAYKSTELASLMEDINHPNLRICLDLSNSLGAMEGPEYVMEKLGPWCGNFVFKDVIVRRSQTSMGLSVEGRPSGEGQIPVKWALEQLQSCGAEHSTIIELWPPWQGDISSTVKLEEKWVAQSVEFMKGLLNS